MNPDKRFSTAEINRLKRGAPQGFGSMSKKPRASYNPSRPDAKSSHVHPQGPHNVPRRPPTLEPKRFHTSLFNIPVQNQSSQIHTQSNNTASLPLLIRPWQDRRQLNFFPGDIMFIKKDTRGRLRTVQDLVGMNRSFMAIEDSEETADERRDKTDALIKEYNFYGIYRNKTNVENQGYTRGSSYHQNDVPRGKSQQELINVDVFGRSKVGNMFSSDTNVLRGDHLGLALITYDHLDRTRTRFVPTLNGKLSYIAPSGKTEILRWIPLGICSFSTRKVAWTKDIIEDADKNRKLPQLELLML